MASVGVPDVAVPCAHALPATNEGDVPQHPQDGRTRTVPDRLPPAAHRTTRTLPHVRGA